MRQRRLQRCYRYADNHSHMLYMYPNRKKDDGREREQERGVEVYERERERFIRRGIYLSLTFSLSASSSPVPFLSPFSQVNTTHSLCAQFLSRGGDDTTHTLLRQVISGALCHGVLAFLACSTWEHTRGKQ